MLRLLIVVMCLTISFSGIADTDGRGDGGDNSGHRGNSGYHGVHYEGEQAAFTHINEVVSVDGLKHLQSVVDIANSRSKLVDRMNAKGMNISQMGKEHKGGAE